VQSRLTNQVRGTVRFRQEHYDNQTGEFPFRGVVQYDQSLVRDTVGFHNHPFGNQQTVLGTDWDGWFGHAFNVTVSYDHRQREHTLREVEKDTEDAVRGQVRGQLGGGGYYRLDGGFGHRTGDAFDVEEYQRPDQPDTVYVENPNLRRYDVADRDRTLGNAEVGWSLGERLDVSVNGEWRHDDYGETRYGLTDDERWQLLGQATFTVVDGLGPDRRIRVRPEGHRPGVAGTHGDRADPHQQLEPRGRRRLDRAHPRPERLSASCRRPGGSCRGRSQWTQATGSAAT
jgi:hypothetical protein